jgi:hypothetical protein
MGDRPDLAAPRKLGEKEEVVFGNTDINHPKVDITLSKKESNPLAEQIGGGHYKGFTIQPVEFITKNNLSFLQGCIIKRICRYNLKGTPLEDLQKIKHEVDLLIELDGLERNL